jgi:hypothetical protein
MPGRFAAFVNRAAIPDALARLITIAEVTG